MSRWTLVIGNKNYSSWSLRAWLLLRQLGIPFEEVQLLLDTAEFARDIGRYSPSRHVPALIDGPIVVWESLAICEYAAEGYPDRGIWPAATAARAHARSVAAEMHAGFTALRTELPMNCRARRTGVAPSPAAQRDIARVCAIWTDCRARYGDAGSWLFGPFSAADAMFAPVVFRFRTYAVDLPAVAATYCAHLLDQPALREWVAAAASEPVLPRSERGIAVQ